MTTFPFFKRKAPIEQRRQERSTMAARLANAEAQEAHELERATLAAIEGDDAASNAAKRRTRGAQDDGEIFRAALARVDAEIAAQEQKAAADADKRLREETARDLNSRADKFDRITPQLVEVLRDACAVAELATPISCGETAATGLFRQLIDELPTGFAFIAGELRVRAGLVLTGQAPATLPAPVEIILPAPPIPRQTVFLLKDAKWRDPELQLQFAERFSFASVPVELARKATEIGVAVPPESEQAQKLRYNKRGAPPIPEKCIDLDTGELPQPPSGNVPWDAFKHIDRGPPMKAFMPSPSFEGARNQPSNNDPNDEK